MQRKENENVATSIQRFFFLMLLISESRYSIQALKMSWKKRKNSRNFSKLTKTQKSERRNTGRGEGREGIFGRGEQRESQTVSLCPIPVSRGPTSQYLPHILTLQIY